MLEQVIVLIALLVGASVVAYCGHLWATRRPRAEKALADSVGRLLAASEENKARAYGASVAALVLCAERPTPWSSDAYAVPRLRALAVWVDAQTRRLEEEFPVAAK